MKTTKKPKSAEPEDAPLIEEPKAAPRLAILTRTINGQRSRCAKLPPGMIVPTKKGGVHPALVVHVGYVEHVTLEPHGETWTRWREAKNEAEFDGPTAIDAADRFVKLMTKGLTKTSAARCVADGPVVRVTKWRQRSKGDETTIRYV